MALVLRIFRVDLISNDRYTPVFYRSHSSVLPHSLSLPLAFVGLFQDAIGHLGLYAHDTLACPPCMIVIVSLVDVVLR